MHLCEGLCEKNRGISYNEMPLFLSVYSWYDDEEEGHLPSVGSLPCRPVPPADNSGGTQHDSALSQMKMCVRQPGVYAWGWRASHEAFCTPEFFVKHTDVYQLEYLKKRNTKREILFLLLAPGPVGVVSVHGPLLEHLCAAADAGARLRHPASALCAGAGAYVLWVLDNNRRAIGWYESWGFAFPGRAKRLSPALRELEMARRGPHAAPGVHERENGI